MDVISSNKKTEVKVAIVVVAYNNLQYTKITLESVLKYTTVPYALFLVNNGSEDGTKEYFETLSKDNPKNIYVIESDTNLGFAGGNNAALKVIQEDPSFTHVLLLNNDTIVTENYLEKMLLVMNVEPNIGLVGPVSNNVGGVQMLRGIKVAPENVQIFARELSKVHGNKCFEAGLLVGFCLLIKREVLDNVGLLDEDFGKGMWEDNDYCLRARIKGYLAYCALGAFVFHFGSKTIGDGKVLDGGSTRKQFLDNKKIFYDKWAKINKLGEHKKIVGMIRVKNGGGLLREVLDKVSQMVDEIVVFDDHSTDDTEQTCKACSKVVDYYKSTYEIFDEARDRQHVLEMAQKRNPWAIYCFDSDEVPESRLIRDIQKIVNDPNPETQLWCFKMCHIWDSKNDTPGKEGSQWRADGLWGSFWQGRLFRNLPGQMIKRKGDSVNFHSGSHPYVSSMFTKKIPYRILHYGNQDPQLRLKKYLWYTATDKVKDVGNILGGWAKWYKKLYSILEDHAKKYGQEPVFKDIKEKI